MQFLTYKLIVFSLVLWRPQNSQTLTDPTQFSQPVKALKSLSHFSKTFRPCEPCKSRKAQVTLPSPFWREDCRWFKMAARMVGRHIICEHCASPSVNSSLQHHLTSVVCVSALWTKKTGEHCAKSCALVWHANTNTISWVTFVSALWTKDTGEHKSIANSSLQQKSHQHSVSVCEHTVKTDKVIPVYNPPPQTLLQGVHEQVKKGAGAYSREHLEAREGACPVHGEEEQAGGALTDVVDVQISRHGWGRGQCELEVGLRQQGTCPQTNPDNCSTSASPPFQTWHSYSLQCPRTVTTL